MQIICKLFVVGEQYLLRGKLTRQVFVLILLSFLAATAIDDVSGEYSNVVLASQISTKVKNGEPISCDNSVIEGNLSLVGSTANAVLLINNSTINGTIHFNNMIFLKLVRFENTKFNRDVDFRRSWFNDTAIFSRSTFNQTTTFIDSEFEEYAVFSECQFEESANFQGSKFNRNAEFSKSEFGEYVNFRNSEFMDSVYFIGSRFRKYADFNGSQFHGYVGFSKSHFGYVSFIGSKFYEFVDFGGSYWDDYVDFIGSQFNKIAYFAESQFNKSADFQGSLFSEEAVFNDAKFQGEANFNNCHFGGDARYLNTTFRGVLLLNRTKYDKFYVHWNNINLAYDDTAYQLLIENFKKLGFLDDADNCYYQFRKEQFLHRELMENPIRYILDLGAWIFYGFGIKPEFSIIWSVIIIIVFGTNFWRSLREVETLTVGHLSFEEWLGFSARVFLSGTKLFIDPPEIPGQAKRCNPWIGHAFILERILGALFSVLFFLSVAKTIIR